jgi:hypothetical protein
MCAPLGWVSLARTMLPQGKPAHGNHYNLARQGKFAEVADLDSDEM